MKIKIGIYAAIISFIITRWLFWYFTGYPTWGHCWLFIKYLVIATTITMFFLFVKDLYKQHQVKKEPKNSSKVPNDHRQNTRQ